MASKSNRLGKLVFVAVLIVMGAKWYSERDGSKGHGVDIQIGGDTPDAEEGDGAPQTSEAAYALAGTRDNWPPLDANAASAIPVGGWSATNYYLVLDGSGSMRRTECSGGRKKIDTAVSALQAFIDQVPPSANLGLAVFDDEGLAERVPLGADNRPAVAAALRQVIARGGTPLRSAISLGYERLSAQARQQLGYGDYHLVVVTDGAPDPSSEDPSEIVDRMLDESPVILHTIGFCIGEDHVLNQPGRSFYTAADSPEQLARGLDDVLSEAPSFDLSSFQAADDAAR